MIERVLVIAPHPDDEVLGCGGTIKKITSVGSEAYILIMTRGRKELYTDDKIINVRNEARNAHRKLGISETIFLDFSAPGLDQVLSAELSNAIYQVLISYKIDSVYLPHRGDIHLDHKAVFNAGLVACRPCRDHGVKKIYAYETLSETEWAPPFSDHVFSPTRFVNISDFIEAKTIAMQSYKSQLKEYPNPRSLQSIEALAKFRGSTCGYKYAEAFMTIRIIED